MESEVSLIRCDTYKQEALYSKVSGALSLLGGITSFVSPGSKVLVKPNLLMAAGPEENITTHPEFVRAVVRILKEIKCRIYIGDGPSIFGGQAADALNVYEKTGIKKVASEEGIELVLFDKRYMHGKFPLVEWVRECDHIISLPKFKTHEFMILTGAIKNMFGLVPGTFKMELHKNFSKPEEFAGMLMDIYQAAPPSISIVDAISGLEGNGPATSGLKRNFGLILASADAVALDCVLARLINVKMEYIFTNLEAQKRKIGNTDLNNIKIKGESISSCCLDNFKLPETSLKQAMRNKLPAWLVNILKRLLTFRPKIDSDICRLCEACVKNCPQKTIANKNGKMVIDYSRCIYCFCCREVCPHRAIKMKKSLLAKVMRM